MRLSLIPAAGLLSLAACANTDPAMVADLGAALTVASAAESAYAAQPHANPATVAQLERLLIAAQSAFSAWKASPGSAEQAALTAAINALVAYEASAGVATLG